MHLSVAIFIFHFRIKWLNTGRQNYRPYIYFYLLLLLMKIDGVVLADAFANKTFLLLEVKTVLINICDQRNCLREVYMDGFIRRYVLIVWIRDLDRTVLYTSRTTSAIVFYNVSGLLDQGCLKVSCFPFYTVNFSKCQDFYIWMPADLDQFG